MNKNLKKLLEQLEQIKLHLITAKRLLDEAENWSLLDAISSGPVSIFADFMEYSRFNKVKLEIMKAKSIYKLIKDDLKRTFYEIPDLNLTGLWFTLDVFFDSLPIDIIRHFKLKAFKNRIEESIYFLDKIIYALKEK